MRTPEWKLLIELGAVQSVTDNKSYTLVEAETLTFGTVPGRQVTDAGRNQLVLSEVVLGTAKITTDVDNTSPASLSLSVRQYLDPDDHGGREHNDYPFDQ